MREALPKEAIAMSVLYGTGAFCVAYLSQPLAGVQQPVGPRRQRCAVTKEELLVSSCQSTDCLELDD